MTVISNPKDISCEVCGFRFRYSDRKRIHSHHLRPKEHGGDDSAANRIILCPNCHSIAHILLSRALDSHGIYDIYLLYSRDMLIADILRYRRESTRGLMRRAYRAFLTNIQIVLRFRF